MIITLSDLMPGAHQAQFLAHFTAKTRWHATFGNAERAKSLLPWPLIDRLIAQDGIPPDQMRVVLNRNDAQRRMYRDEGTNRIRGDALQGMIDQGATFLVNNLGHLVPAIDELAVNIERILRCKIHINGYFSFGRHSAFRTHADGHDVVILQLHGSKHWRCFGQNECFPLRGRHTTELTEVQWEGVLHPGDVLYVPRGDVHSAVPEVPPSVHLTIGITENTGIDFVRWLADRAADDARFRQSLPLGGAASEAAQREADLKQALHALIESSSFEQLMSSEDRSRPLRVVASLDFAERLTPASILISSLKRPLVLETADPETFKVEIGGSGIRLSQRERCALAALTDAPRLSYADLAVRLGTTVDDGALRAALVDLARKALIAIADTP